MTREVPAAVGMRHGETCTCRPLDPVTVNVEPVLVNERCPGRRQATNGPEPAGRLVITWPAPKPTGMGLHNWGVTISDADTGEPILTAFKLSIVLGTDTAYKEAAIEADVTALVDENGNLLGNEPGSIDRAARGDAPDEPEWRTKVFRYLVAEMRVAQD